LNYYKYIHQVYGIRYVLTPLALASDGQNQADLFEGESDLKMLLSSKIIWLARSMDSNQSGVFELDVFHRMVEALSKKAQDEQGELGAKFKDMVFLETEVNQISSLVEIFQPRQKIVVMDSELMALFNQIGTHLNVLEIPDPRLFIKNPSLKKSAWQHMLSFFF